MVVAGVLALILAAVYLLKPRRMPTVDIRKFPRKFSDEKVTFFTHRYCLHTGITITQKSKNNDPIFQINISTRLKIIFTR